MSTRLQRCRWCATTFYNTQDLNAHENIHRQLDSLGNGASNYQETSDGFRCQECTKLYSTKSNLERHKKADHTYQSFLCSKCSKSFKYSNDRVRHQKTCEGNEHSCSKCNKLCSTAYGLRRHLQYHEKQPKKRSERESKSSRQPPNKTATQYRCRRCIQKFNNRHDLYIHGMREHYQTGGRLQIQPWNADNAPWLRDGNDDSLRNIYEANRPLILEPHRQGPINSVYNFPLDNDVTIIQLMEYANDIYRREQHAFRLNLVFGVILQHRETGQYRYFIPYNNNGILERPFYISRRSDLDRLRLRLRRMDIITELLRIRPDTKWFPVLVTNIHFTLYSTSYVLGEGMLPDYLFRKDSIYPLVNNRRTGKAFNDNLCAFRCLALHRGYDIRAIEGPSFNLYRQWVGNFHQEFNGISFEDFPDFEIFYKVNLEVYSLEDDGIALIIYKSRGLQADTMYVNMYENHLSFIKNFSLYAKKYRCTICDRNFDHAGNLHRHLRSCENKTKYVYPGGFYQYTESIFERLEQFGINVPEVDKTFPWFICFDFEALLQKVNDRPTEMLEWTQRHIPVSVSICSNVEGYTEPLCIVEQDQDTLLQKMIDQMINIANRVHELSEDKWGWVLEAIDFKIDEENKITETLEENQYNSDDEESEEETTKQTAHPLKRLHSEMEGYISQVPVLGFNSAKYDLNLVKKRLAKQLNMHDKGMKGSFVVKKNNSYTCISTDQLRFLDISQFLAVGSSYSGFLKAYGIKEQKGFFPYEWLDDMTKLNHPALPSHESFYSTLKERNISEDEYQYCQQIWRDAAMSEFKDFLVWYNNLDVGPFVNAVERFQTFYFNKGIDVFKTSISVPGIARQLLFRTARKHNANFALFDKSNSDLYQTIKQNIVGGPSIIFTRHHCVGQTSIRDNKICGSILGFDANALYLQAIGQPMPVGMFIRRKSEKNFRPELRDKYMVAYHWMEWIMHTQNVYIQHRLNSGREVRVGKYPVDGYSKPIFPEQQPTVYQFHGCYWHGHDCEVTFGIKDEKWWKNREQKLRKTKETTTFLKARGCNVIELWECEFGQYCRKNPHIYVFIDSMRPAFFKRHKGKIQTKQILDGVVHGELFGMVEVDIEVPETWPAYFQHPTLTPSEYFQEMSPLFCTSDIPFEDIGCHMQKHVEKFNLSKDSRRLLVGGMKGKQMLIATPLLKWYLNHGMVVTKIYQVVEFQEQRCFKDFIEEVSDARRQGDIKPDTAIIADTMKVIGNSGYGSLIMDKTKHRNIQYIKGENKTCLKINEPCFRKLDCLDQEEQYYEVEMAKKRIKLNLPIQLGYFILQYAKLRMLQFYFDFMDKYVDRSDFEYCEMDTDSAYMAISGSCLKDVIKPEMREKYQQGLTDFCSDIPMEADAMFHWFPRTCCTKHGKYDKRTPGLFKLEYQGDEMIGLCSKTYIVRKSKVIKPSAVKITAYNLLRRSIKIRRKRYTQKSKSTNEYKFSSKGISKRTVKAPMTKFRYVLKTHKAESGSNHGFRVRHNRIYTYTQERRGFSYFYCKRKVLNDGIHTSPLDITICPVPVTAEDEQEPFK